MLIFIPDLYHICKTAVLLYYILHISTQVYVNGNKCLHVRYIPLLYIYSDRLLSSFSFSRLCLHAQPIRFQILLQLLAYVHVRSFSFYGAGQLIKPKYQTIQNTIVIYKVGLTHMSKDQTRSYKPWSSLAEFFQHKHHMLSAILCVLSLHRLTHENSRLLFPTSERNQLRYLTCWNSSIPTLTMHNLFPLLK